MKVTNRKNTFSTILFTSLLAIAGCKGNQEMIETQVNKLTAQEVEDGWKLLFDGETSDGWRGFKRQDFPSNWVVENGTLHMKGEQFMSAAEKATRGDIVFDKEFDNFTLKLQWKISENGNSGIFYLGSETAKSFAKDDYIWRNAPEMQVLDNLGHPDANKGENGNRQAGSLYDLIAAKPQNARPVGQWNDIEITVNNRQVTHKQNGVVVVAYTLDTPQWRQLVAQSKFPSLNPTWHDVAQRGLIGLQDHSDPVWFRNIKLKELN